MHQYTVKILQFKNVHNLNSKFINLLYCREPLTTESKHNSETSEEVGQPPQVVGGWDAAVATHRGL